MSEDRVPERPAPRQSLLVPVLIIVGLLAAIGIVLWTFSRVLLQMEPEVATATALVVAAAILAIVAWAASRKRVTNGTLLSVVVGVFGAGMLLSGIALVVGQGAEEGGPEAVTVAIAAPEGAAVSGFDQTALTAPADTPFTIAFNNQDPAVPHNVVIASADPAADPAAEILFEGELITGPQQVDYEVEPLAEAEYFFFCAAHPTTMTGTLTVAAGAEPGTGSSGNVITAANLAFDTDQLEFPADTPSMLTFQNDDAGTPHNVAIYTDESASEALFQGEIVTGVASAEYPIPAIPAGEYFFRCDIHPDMAGTVVVGETSGGGGGGGASPTGAPSAEPPPSEAPPSEAPPPAGGVTVVAKGLQFDPTAFDLPAGAPTTVTFDNQDAGTLHNIAIYTDDTFGEVLFQGELITGVDTIDYEVPALDAGSYPFRCDVHPDMLGTVNVG